MAQFCTHCGFQLTEGAKFCENCGARCEAEPQAQPAPEYDGSQANAYTAPILTPGEQSPAQPYGDPYQQPAGAYGQPSAPQYPYATPINAQQPYAYATPNTPGAPEKKSHLGLGIAIAVTAVVLIAAAIIVFFVWKPFDKKDGDTQPTAAPATSATAPTTYPTHAPATTAPTQSYDTQAPSQSPTDAPSANTGITSADRAQLQQVFSDIVDYGYSRTKADVMNYAKMTFEYNFYLDPEDREYLCESLADGFYDDIDEYKETYGDNYELTVTIKEIEPYEGEDLEDELDYYDDCDVSGVEMIATVTAEAKITGNKGNDSGNWTWDFIRVNGKWYPVA